ncbi:unnamed protein product [Lepidochelys kempii]
MDRNQAVQEWEGTAGDWPFQILVMMEMSSQPGGVYTWQVEHISLQRPLLLEAQADSARDKMLAGVGALLWLVFMVLGVLVRLRNKKGEWLRDSTAAPGNDSPVGP